MAKKENSELKPFVKWVGGKRQLLSVLKEHLPKEFERYLEPFVGGGALLLNVKFKTALINDSNKELVNAYQVIKDHLEELIVILKEHQLKHDKNHYYTVRALRLKDLNKVERAARFIYLNKACFNGLYRVNKKNEFNVPMGNYENPNILDEEGLREVSRFLSEKKVKIFNLPYDQFLKRFSKTSDFIYLDPPYHPLKKTSFTKYQKDGFTEKDQIALSELFKELDQKGVKVLLSNSNTSFIKKLYKGFSITPVHASRSINRDGKNRGKKKIEVLIKNY